jgi:pimeloyl-ACP methyl ester carboxylesterase
MRKIQHWTAKERAMRIAYPLVEERVVDQFLDSQRETGQKFSLYYFVKDLTFNFPKEERTILFASGGPGQIIRATGRNFVDLETYRVVYFHLRGSGFSQIPDSNDYDAYLRTPFAVEDIEAIRRDLGIDQWCAIIGHSYGTVLAQQYSRRYPDRVRKLILSAPLSCHKVVEETKQFESLEMICRSKTFSFFDTLPTPDSKYPNVREHIVKKAKDVSKELEAEYGSVQAYIDAHEEKRRNKYSIPFLRALRRLRHTGWLPFDEDISAGVDSNVSTQQLGSAWVISKEVLAMNKINLAREFERFLQKESNPEQKVRLENMAVVIPWAEDHYRKPQTLTSARTFYVMTFYDGLDVRWRGNSPIVDLKRAMAERGGRQPNESIKRVGILDREMPRAWDPAEYKHTVDTLVVIGGADPVTEGGLAHYFFDRGLYGNRVLMEFPGIGHAMALPALSDADRDLGIVEIQAPKRTVVLDTREALFRTFLEKSFAAFTKDPIIEAIRNSFRQIFETEEYKPEPVQVHVYPDANESMRDNAYAGGSSTETIAPDFAATPLGHN